MTTDLDLLCSVPFHEADAGLRSQILSRLADTELHVLLLAEPSNDRAELRIYDLPSGPVALATDDAAELARFVGGPADHLSLPGRALAASLAESGRGLLLNPGRPSEMLLDPAMLGWLGQALDVAPETDDAARARLTQAAPDVISTLVEPLARRLSDMTGLIAGASLVGAVWPDGRKGHLLVIADAQVEDRPAIAKALAELLAFLPPVDGGVDITFDHLPLPAGALRIDPAQVPTEPPAKTVQLDHNGKGPPPRLRW